MEEEEGKKSFKKREKMKVFPASKRHSTTFTLKDDFSVGDFFLPLANSAVHVIHATRPANCTASAA